MIHKFNVSTESREILKDITSEVEKVVRKSGISDGVCYIYTPHTTCGLTINENADPSVKTDMIMGLNDIVNSDLPFRHMEGNSDSHIKSSLMGFSQMVFIENSRLALGTWQGIYLTEFDGPRTRKVYVKILKG